MQIEEVKQVFESHGRQVADCDIKGYYKVNGKQRSERSLVREAKKLKRLAIKKEILEC